jgi:asparagine synthase (glutamine-hydrolysing)
LWKDGNVSVRCWYSLPDRIPREFDVRSDDEVAEEYQALLEDSVRLRFRSDVPVAINLSGGLDSSLLLGLVHRVQGEDSNVRAFTFTTGDSRYDELPWVQQMLAETRHSSTECRLRPADVPGFVDAMQECQDAPFGGIPTVAYAKLFATARDQGRIVLLDGQGIDEQWAGYDYYRATVPSGMQPIQGTSDSPIRPECLLAGFRALAEPAPACDAFSDSLRNRQYNDVRFGKIPRALRCRIDGNCGTGARSGSSAGSLSASSRSRWPRLPSGQSRLHSASGCAGRCGRGRRNL